MKDPMQYLVIKKPPKGPEYAPGSTPCCYSIDPVFTGPVPGTSARTLLLRSGANVRQPMLATGFQITCESFDVSVFIDLRRFGTTWPRAPWRWFIRCRCAHLFSGGQKVST
jgi:hypothetical protein